MNHKGFCLSRCGVFLACLVLSFSPLLLAEAPVWNDATLGLPALAGSSNEWDGKATIFGGGTDIWGTSDQGHFRWFSLTEDAQIIARVLSVQNTHTSAKAGIMMRSGLGASAQNVFLAMTAGKNLTFQRRLTDGGTTVSTVKTSQAFPMWIRLERRGNTVVGYYSTDGVNWSFIGAEALPAGEWQAGFAVTSHDAAKICKAEFDRIQIGLPPAVPAPYLNTDIGSVGRPGLVDVTQDGKFLVRGSGAEIGGALDSFHFVHRGFSGDGFVSSVATLSTPTSGAKAGLILRESLAPDGRMVALLISSSTVIFSTRYTDGTVSQAVSKTGTFAGSARLKLERRGRTIIGYYSTDGENWTVLSSAAIDFGPDLLAGIGYCSRNNSTLGYATFEAPQFSGFAASLPPPWKTEDIGKVTRGGFVDYSAGVFSVQGAGQIPLTTGPDSFQLVSQTAEGDGWIIARVSEHNSSDPSAKAGVMIRGGSSTGAAFTAVVHTPGYGVVLNHRSKEGAATTSVKKLGVTTPVWVRLERWGSRTDAYYSTDGGEWVYLGTQPLQAEAQTLTGLVVASNSNTVLGNAKFDNVNLGLGGAAKGLLGEYYDNSDFTGIKFTRIDPVINFSWSGSPDSALSSDWFSIRWTGKLLPRYTETYTLSLGSDDAVRLWIDGNLLIDAWTPHSYAERSAEVALDASRSYDIQIDYMEKTGSAAAKLFWSSQTKVREIVPPDALAPADADIEPPSPPANFQVEGINETSVRLSWEAANDNKRVVEYAIYRDGELIGTTALLTFTDKNLAPGVVHTYEIVAIDSSLNRSVAASFDASPLVLARGGTGLRGRYFDTRDFGDLKATRLDSAIDFAWGTGSPDPLIEADTFSVLLDGQIEPESTELHTFYLTSDDGAQLWINGKLVVDDWSEHGVRTKTGAIALKGGEKANILVRYFDATGDTRLKLEWSTPLTARRLIPSTALYTTMSDVDSLAPSAPAELQVLRLSDRQLTISWSAAADDFGVQSYSVYRNGQLAATVTGTRFHDGGLTPETQYSYAITATDFTGKISGESSPLLVTTERRDLPAPWQHADVGAVVLAGDLQIAPGIDSEFTLEASGTDIGGRSDSFYYVYRPIPANGEIIAKVEGLSLKDAKAGIMVRESLAPDAIQVTVSQTQTGASMMWRPSPGLLTSSWNRSGVVGNPWMRLVRKGNIFSGYLSYDGQNWSEIGTRYVQMSGQALVGIALCSKSNAAIATCKFANIAVVEDTDGDGLSDAREQELGTDLNRIDSDGDGISDFDEVITFGTNPNVAEIRTEPGVILTSGAITDVTAGWNRSGGKLIGSAPGGTVTYAFTVSDAGIYRVQIAGVPQAKDGFYRYQFRLTLDGKDCGVIPLEGVANAVAEGSGYLPWIAAGSHSLALEWLPGGNPVPIEIRSVTLSALGGLDANGDQRPDWAATYLQNTNGILVAPAQSPVSPVCIEGRARFPDLVAVNGVAAELGTKERWYADLALTPGEPVQALISYEGGAQVETRQITWSVTNVADGGELVVRRGDALLLTLSPPDEGIGEVSLYAGETLLASFSSDRPVPRRFENAGEYVLRAEYRRAEGEQVVTLSGAVKVKVADADFGAAPAVWSGYQRPWTCPNVPASVAIDADPRLFLKEKAPVGSRVFTLGVDAAQQRNVLARLAPGGPIIASVPVQGFDLRASADVYVRFVETLEDGSRIVEMGVVSQPVVEDVTVDLKIFVGGVTFDDGTISKRLKAADFDESGMAKVRFIYPKGQKTSVCHTMKVYQGNVLLGTR